MITIQELADLLGLSYQAVKYRMRKLEIQSREPGNTVTEEEAREIAEFQDGRSK